jgi:cell division protein FtsW
MLYLAKLLTRSTEKDWDNVRFQMTAALILASAMILELLTRSSAEVVMLGLTAIAIAIFARKTLFGLFTLLLQITMLILLAWFSPYRYSRFLTILDPYGDPLGRGYPLIQSIIALKNGFPWGLGLGNGSNSILEVTSTFIFSHLFEEFGILTLLPFLLVIILFCKLLVAVIHKEQNSYLKTVTSGFIVFLILQITINILVVTASMPTIPVVLPVVANSGSSIIFSFIHLGILAAAFRQADIIKC